MRRSMMLALVAVTMLGCGASQQQLADKELEAQKYQKEMQDEAARAAALEKKNAALQTQVATLEKQLSQTTATAQATTSQLKAESAELKARQAAVLNTQVLFAENSSVLSADAKRALDTAADAISQLSDKAVIIAAFTDDTEGGKNGTVKRWQLSSARALEVAKYLMGRKIDPKMLGVAGFGEVRPIAPNDSISNRGLNRRVELALVPADLNLKTMQVAPAKIEK